MKDGAADSPPQLKIASGKRALPRYEGEKVGAILTGHESLLLSVRLGSDTPRGLEKFSIKKPSPKLVS